MTRIFTEEELISYGLVYTASRSIRRIDKTDVKCYLCGKIDSKVPLHQILEKHKVTSHGWRCRDCFKKACSETAKQRTGSKNGSYGKKQSKETQQKRHEGYQAWLQDKESVAATLEKRAQTKIKNNTPNPMHIPEVRMRRKEVFNSPDMKEVFSKNMIKKYESREERDKTAQKSKEFFKSDKGGELKKKMSIVVRRRNLDSGSDINIKRLKNLLDKVKYTPEEMYEKIFAIHGDEYVLDKTTYKHSHGKARFVDKDFGEHYALVSNVASGASHPSRGNLKSQETSLARYGANHHMNTAPSRKKVFGKREKTKPEKKFEEMLINRGFVYKYEPDGMEKAWDFVVYKDSTYKEIIAIIEIDGEFSHSTVSDPFGPKMAGYKDAERFSMVPDGVKYIQVDSQKVELGFKELLSCFSISYDQWILAMFDNCTNRPFPFPQFTDKRMLRDWKNLNRFTEYTKKGGAPSISIINNFHKSIYTSNKKDKPSPFQAWSNPILLEKCIKNRFIYCPAADITSMHIARGFEKNYIAPKVSVFKPSMARYLLNKYAPDSVLVRDPFSGFSGRMLGAVSLGKQYVGTDIREDVVAESNEIIKFLNIVDKARVSVSSINDLEVENLGTQSVILTCPPYGLTEQWSIKLVNKSEERWIEDVLSKIHAEKYIFVVKNIGKYLSLLKEDIQNKSHFSDSREYVLVGTKEDFLKIS